MVGCFSFFDQSLKISKAYSTLICRVSQNIFTILQFQVSANPVLFWLLWALFQVVNHISTGISTHATDIVQKPRCRKWCATFKMQRMCNINRITAIQRTQPRPESFATFCPAPEFIIICSASFPKQISIHFHGRARGSIGGLPCLLWLLDADDLLLSHR